MMSLSLPHTHTHERGECVSTTLGDYVNEMKYSDGLVSQLNVCDCGEETETKRRRGERGRLTAGRRERERERGADGQRQPSVALSACLSLCLATRHAVMDCGK